MMDFTSGGLGVRVPGKVKRLRSVCVLGVLCLFVAGCESAVSLREMDAAEAKCATNGGARWLTAGSFFGGDRTVRVVCVNGMSGYIELKAEPQ